MQYLYKVDPFPCSSQENESDTRPTTSDEWEWDHIPDYSRKNDEDDPNEYTALPNQAKSEIQHAQHAERTQLLVDIVRQETRVEDLIASLSSGKAV